MGDIGEPAVRRIIVAATLLIAFMATARADRQDGVAAYERGDYATALREWRPLSVQGDAGAQFNLGVMYKIGRGVPQSDGGPVHGKGQGVPQDYVQAHTWLNLAAAQGTKLVSMNRDIIADKMTPGESHLEYSAPQGARMSLVSASLVEFGSAGTLRSTQIWLKQSKCDGPEMTPAQIAEAQRLAREWKPKKQ